MYVNYVLSSVICVQIVRELPAPAFMFYLSLMLHIKYMRSGAEKVLVALLTILTLLHELFRNNWRLRCSTSMSLVSLSASSQCLYNLEQL